MTTLSTFDSPTGPLVRNPLRGATSVVHRTGIRDSGDLGVLPGFGDNGEGEPVNVRILRIEVRRTIAPWAGLAVAVIALGFLFSFSGPWVNGPLAWDRQWTHAAFWTRFLLVLLWPLVVGAGAVQGMRDSRSGVVELLGTAPRPGLHRAAGLATAVAVPVVLGYLLVFAVGAVQVIANGGFFSFDWLPIVLVGVLAMIAGAWIGLGVGKLLPHPLTAPALVVAVFTAVIAFRGGVIPLRVALLSPAFEAVDDPFFTTSGRVDLGQAIWLVGLALTGLLALAARSRWAKVLAAVPVVVGLAVALPVLPATPAEGRGVDPVAIARVCDGPVCVTRMHEAELARIAGPGKEALRLLGTLPDAPVQVVELDRRLGLDEVPPRTADAVVADLSDPTLRLSTEADDLTRALLAGAGTPSCLDELGGPSRLDELTARTIAAAWFLGELKPLKGNIWVGGETARRTGRAWATFRALPADEQRERIIALRRAGLTCQGNQLDILVGDGPR
jgi:hypothetical protein